MVGLPVLDVDATVLAQLVQNFCDHRAEVRVSSRNRGDPSKLLFVLDVGGVGGQVFHDCRAGLLHTVAEHHCVHAGGDHAEPLGVYGLGEDRSGAGAVAGAGVGLLGGLVGDQSAGVDKRVFEIVDDVGDGVSVVGDQRLGKALLDDHVPAFRTHGDPHRLGEDIDALFDGCPGFWTEQYLFTGHVICAFRLCVERDSSSGWISVGGPKAAHIPRRPAASADPPGPRNRATILVDGRWIFKLRRRRVCRGRCRLRRIGRAVAARTVE